MKPLKRYTEAPKPRKLSAKQERMLQRAEQFYATARAQLLGVAKLLTENEMGGGWGTDTILKVSIDMLENAALNHEEGRRLSRNAKANL